MFNRNHQLILATTSILMLSGCDEAPKAAREIKKEYIKSVNAPEISAINEVFKSYRVLSAAYNQLGSNLPTDKKGTVEMFKGIQTLTASISAIDVSNCPPDFRGAWYPLRDAAQNVSVQCALIPTLEGNPESGKAVMEKFVTESNKLQNAQTEVQVVGKKYGVAL